MDSIEVKLRRLRGWFIACFAAEAFIGIVTSIGVLDRLRMLGLPGLDSDSVSFSVVISLFVLAVLLVLALWVFEALLQELAARGDVDALPGRPGSFAPRRSVGRGERVHSQLFNN